MAQLPSVLTVLSDGGVAAIPPVSVSVVFVVTGHYNHFRYSFNIAQYKPSLTLSIAGS